MVEFGTFVTRLPKTPGGKVPSARFPLPANVLKLINGNCPTLKPLVGSTLMVTVPFKVTGPALTLSGAEPTGGLPKEPRLKVNAPPVEEPTVSELAVIDEPSKSNTCTPKDVPSAIEIGPPL